MNHPSLLSKRLWNQSPDYSHSSHVHQKDERPLFRLLMTTDTVGGVWSYALELARELMKKGIHVTLATMGRTLSADQRRQAAFFPPGHIYESQFRLEWMEEPWNDLQEAGAWLLQIEEEVKPDVIHLNSFVHGALPWQAPVVVVGHSCVLSWWQAVKGHDAPPEWQRYHQAVQAGLQSADCVVAPSQWMLSALQCFYGSLKNSTIIYNGRRSELFRPGNKDPFLFTAGRLWDEGKNIAALTRIASLLPWPCVLAGESAVPGGAPHEHGSDHVQQLGYLSDQEVASWLSRAAIYVLPAKYEPFGLSAVEAGLAGCALVLGDIPSLREIWEDAAVFVPPEDDQALCSALNKLFEDKTARENSAWRAQQRAQRFSATQMAAGYLSLYDTLVQTPHPHRTHLHGNERPCAW